MTFFKNLGETLHNSDFYHSLKERSLKSSFGYFAKLSLVLGALSALASAVLVAPIFSKMIGDIKTEVLSFYPEKLEIKVEKGIASSNADHEPLFFPFKDSWKKVILQNKTEFSEVNKGIQNIFVLNVKNTASTTPEIFKNMDTYALLTKNFFIHYDKDYNIVFEELSKYKDFTLSHETFVKIFGMAKYIPFLLPFAYFAFTFTGSFFLLLYALVATLIFFIVVKFQKLDLSFKDSYKICIFAASAPAVLSLFFFFSGMPIPIIQNLFILLTALIAVINTKPHKEFRITN